MKWSATAVYWDNGTAYAYNDIPFHTIFYYNCRKGGDFIEIQRNMANVIRALKETSGKTLSELSAQLEISRSALQEYLSGQGNPSAATIEHLAQKLGVDTSFLISGVFSGNQIEILLKLLEMLKALSALSAEQRTRFVQLLQEMVSLWNEGDNNA